MIIHYKLLKQITRNILGSVCILLGIIGIFLPLLPGFLLIFIGVTFLDFRKKKAVIFWFKNLKLIRPFAKKYDEAKIRLKLEAQIEKEKLKNRLRAERAHVRKKLKLKSKKLNHNHEEI